VVAPQSLTVWSDEADASSLPSLEKATEMTEPVPLLYSSSVQKCVRYTVLGMKFTNALHVIGSPCTVHSY
jgi:hypothetical protein